MRKVAWMWSRLRDIKPTRPSFPLSSSSQTMKAGLLGKGLLYFVIVAGFIGPAFLAIPVGSIHIFPYRVLLPLLWLILVVGILLQGRVDLLHMKVKPYLRFLAFWLLYAVLSLAWALSKADAIRDIIFLFMGASAIFFVVYYFSNDKDLKRLFYLWLAVLACLLLLGFWEHLTGQHLPVSGYYGETRDILMFTPTGVFRNPNDYATYLALSIPFIFVLIRYRRNIVTRSVSLVVLLASFYLLFVTGSRANFLAVISEFVFLFAFLLKLKGKLRAIILVGLLVLALVIALPGSMQQITGAIGKQIESIASELSPAHGSTGVRINLIKNSLSFLGKTGGFGVGAGNAEGWMASRAIHDTHGILNPHNWWLELMANYGILIFVGYVLFYLGLIARLYRIHRRLGGRTETMICEALLVALVGFFLASISSSSIMALTFQWFLFAFALAFLNYQRRMRLNGAT